MTLYKSAIIIALSFAACCAGAENKYNYAGARLSGVFPGNISGNSDLQSSSPNASYSVGLFVGRKFADRFALAFEYTNRRESDLNSTMNYENGYSKYQWGVSADTFMLNLAVNIIQNDQVEPYVFFGAGGSRNKANQYVFTTPSYTATWKAKNTMEFAWQAGVGADMKITQNILFNLQYSYIDRGQFKTQNGCSYSDGSELTTISAKTGKLQDQVISFGFKFKVG